MSWSDPTPQQYKAQESDGVKRLVGAVQDVAQKTRDATKNLLRTAGIFLTDTGMRIESALTVNGDFASTGSADITGTTHIGGSTDIDGTLNVDANATFGGTVSTTGAMSVGGTMVVTGNATFQGNLAVPNGSIDNAALASPLVIVAAAPATGSGWAVSTGMEAKASSSIPVPAGFSRATVTAWANMHFMDSSPNGGWVRASIAGEGGAEMGGLANLQLGQGATHTRSLTGLSGGSIGVSCDVRASVGTAGMSGRIAQITAVAYFQR